MVEKKMAKEKEENLWRGKIYFSKEMKNGEGKGEKYLEKENIVFWSEEKSQERKWGNYLEKKNLFFCGGDR